MLGGSLLLQVYWNLPDCCLPTQKNPAWANSLGCCDKSLGQVVKVFNLDSTVENFECLGPLCLWIPNSSKFSKAHILSPVEALVNVWFLGIFPTALPRRKGQFGKCLLCSASGMSPCSQRQIIPVQNTHCTWNSNVFSICPLENICNFEAEQKNNTTYT